MQVFLPYPSFSESAKVLDNKRLGKQRVEVLQILKAILDPSYGWQNHPAVRMWRPYRYQLANYGLHICEEWTERGYKDTCYRKICELFNFIIPFGPYPPWLGNEDFHAAHRSNLLRKNPEWYGQFGWTEPDDLEYIWPII